MSGFMGSINAGDLFTNEEIESMEPKVARRIVRHMSSSNKTVKLWCKLIFTTVEILFAAHYLSVYSSVQLFSNPSTVSLNLVGVPVPPMIVRAVPWCACAAQGLVAVFIALNSFKRRMFSLLYLTTILYVLSGVPLLLIRLQTNVYVTQMPFYICVTITIVSIFIERASYRADQGLYELKRTVMDTNKTRNEK